jgi:hypothetical protein
MSNHIYAMLTQHEQTTTEPRSQHISLTLSKYDEVNSAANHTMKIFQYCP